MKKTVMKKWVKALRSGEYKQTKGRLRNSVGFCCLGVLCDIYAKDKKIKEFWIPYGHAFSAGDTDAVFLPTHIKKYSNLKSVNGSIGNMSLAGQNDRGKTFPEIADIIEQHCEEL